MCKHCDDERYTIDTTQLMVYNILKKTAGR